MTYMYQGSHDKCQLCEGKGYVSDGSIEDGMMSGRVECPGPYFKHRWFNTENEMHFFTHDVMGLHEGLMVRGCLACNGDM